MTSTQQVVFSSDRLRHENDSDGVTTGNRLGRNEAARSTSRSLSSKEKIENIQIDTFDICIDPYLTGEIYGGGK